MGRRNPSLLFQGGKMRILRPKGEKLTIDDRTYHLLFNINTIDEIQEHFDKPIDEVLNDTLDLKNTENKKQSYNKIAYMLATLINQDVERHNKKSEDKWEKISEEWLKEEILTNETAIQAMALILKAFNGSVDTGDEKDPNQKSVQVKK